MPLPLASSLPVSTTSPVPASPNSEFDNSPWIAGLAISGVILADDITAIGIADDILIPLVLSGAGIATIVINWDWITNKFGTAFNVLFSDGEGKAIEDFQKNPGDWEKTGEKSEPATGRKYKGGKSVEESFRNKHTGQEIKRHRIYDPSGRIVHDHFRVK